MDSKARQPEPAPASPPSDAFERRLEEHVGLLRRFVRAKAGRVVRAKEPVSDLVQSIVREACGAPLRGDEDDEAFRSWLCTIAAHKIISKNRFYSAERRDSARERPIDDARRGLDSEDETSPIRRVERDEDLDRLRRALDDLDPVDREILVLSKLLGVPTPAIADRVRLAPSTVRGRLARAMTELAVRLA
jgi:RNA polymerase sigma-70 factor (ECF subfamily)